MTRLVTGADSPEGTKRWEWSGHVFERVGHHERNRFPFRFPSTVGACVEEHADRLHLCRVPRIAPEFKAIILLKKTRPGLEDVGEGLYEPHRVGAISELSEQEFFLWF